MKLHVVLFGVLSIASGCKKKDAAPPPPPAPPTEGSGSAVTPPPEPAPPAPPAAQDTILKEGFSTPESVLYDEANDRYLVSNINGAPADADDNGYIATVTPDGVVAKWIDGSAADIKLDAPKGMALSGDVLWVADITVVRRFDAKTGKQQGDIKIPGATFLNDICGDGAGGIYVSDSGLDAKFQPTGVDAVYRVDKAGKLSTLIKNKDLGHPNGVALGADGAVWVVTFGTGEVYAVDAKGTKLASTKPPKGQLDGIVLLDGGDALISSWEGKAVYQGKGTDWKEIVTGVESPADIGLDTKRHRLLIPSFQGNLVQLHSL